MLHHVNQLENQQILWIEQPHTSRSKRQPVSRTTNLQRPEMGHTHQQRNNKANATLGFIRRNLRNVPESCRKTAYISLVRYVMEYGATIWNPYLQGDIDKLKRIQNRAVRFIKKDYNSRYPGSITSMKKDLEIDTLEERRLSLRLILMYKVVEGLAPALPTDKSVQFSKRKRQIKPKQFADHISTNIVDKRVCNNSKRLELPSCRTPQ